MAAAVMAVLVPLASNREAEAPKMVDISSNIQASVVMENLAKIAR